jgi:hypothetical protein
MDRDELLMMVRLGMQVLGGALVARGVGDAALWEAAAGVAVIVAGYLASRRSRAALRAQALSGQAALGMLREGLRPPAR